MLLLLPTGFLNFLAAYAPVTCLLQQTSWDSTSAFALGQLTVATWTMEHESALCCCKIRVVHRVQLAELANKHGSGQAYRAAYRGQRELAFVTAVSMLSLQVAGSYR